MINIVLKIGRTGLLLIAIVMGTSITPASAMLNPAAVYCNALGYEYFTESTEEGAVGKCRLPDDQVVDGWDFLRGLTALEWSYCAREGYEALPFDLEICGSCTVCVLEDGTKVSAIKLMNVSFKETTCGDGSCGFPENFATCPEDCPSGGIDEYCDGVADGKCDPDCGLLDESDPDYVFDPDCVGDFDTDGDGVPDSADDCIDDPDKIDPGICGCGVADIDSDGDGTPNCIDGCLYDPNKTEPGVCGCGVADTDSDGDGTPDCTDGCPADPDKTEPGACGCGVADTDSDGDGTLDCYDSCPADPNKTEPGICGCGVADTDSDGDGTLDCYDGCPSDPNKTEPGICGCGVPDTDTDNDGIPDCIDDSEPGDLNGDGCVDRADYDLIMVDIRDGAPNNPAHDLNGDGEVNIADARYLVTLFTNPRGEPCE